MFTGREQIIPWYVLKPSHETVRQRYSLGTTRKPRSFPYEAPDLITHAHNTIPPEKTGRRHTVCTADTMLIMAQRLLACYIPTYKRWEVHAAGSHSPSLQIRKQIAAHTFIRPRNKHPHHDKDMIKNTPREEPGGGRDVYA